MPAMRATEVVGFSGSLISPFALSLVGIISEQYPFDHSDRWFAPSGWGSRGPVLLSTGIAGPLCFQSLDIVLWLTP
jgi:hypothetical protein